jgi:hypothetical protein
MSKGGQQQTYGLPTQTASSSTTSVPGWMTNASQAGVNAATNLLNNPGQAYTGTLAPGMTADQQAAGDMVRNNVGAYQGYYDTAAGLTNAATQQGPQIEAQTYRDGLQNVGDYMNPYIGNVIGGLRQAAADNLSQSLTRTADQAIGAKAFGGSRHGVMEGVATAGANNALNAQIAQLLSGGYDRATNLLGQDISNNMQAQGANQSAYANYLNRLMGAGSQMGALGTANRAATTADINNLMQYGNAQQDTATRQAQAQYQEYLRMQGLPYQALQTYGNTLAQVPYARTTSTTGWSVGPQQQDTNTPLAGGLGGALSGAQVGNMLLPGGMGAGIGAIGGGLLGAIYS